MAPIPAVRPSRAGDFRFPLSRLGKSQRQVGVRRVEVDEMETSRAELPRQIIRDDDRNWRLHAGVRSLGRSLGGPATTRSDITSRIRSITLLTSASGRPAEVTSGRANVPARVPSFNT